MYSNEIQIIAFFLSILLAIYILGLKNGSLDVKLPWVILILVFPVFGSLFYLLFRNQQVRKKIRLNIESQVYATSKIVHDVDNVYSELKLKDRVIFNQSMYIFNTTNMPIYKNTETLYYDSGETFFDALIEELKKAEKFIFMEFFIIRQGKMWNTVFQLLKEKANEGVEIRLLYDDFGCINTLPQTYKKHVEKYGIKCEVFNPIHPIATLAHNNRDHRKIVVIDGIVGFTGGINLADEYINVINRFGHWKDTGIMIKGDAVKSFSLMFLESWHIYRDVGEDYSPYLPELEILEQTVPQKKKRFKRKNKKQKEKKFKEKKIFSETIDIANIPKATSKFIYKNDWADSEEFIQPYMTTPMEVDEIVGRNVYVNILNSAKDYVYITTPYLILDQELQEAIINAAKRSVDVRIITPGIPDKKVVFAVTRSEYTNLLKNGVRIFEYTPGFIHAKNVVSDDTVATIGSINFDNRSFYHSYECGIFLYNSDNIEIIRKDFIKCENLSQEITLKNANKIPLSTRIKTSLFRLFIPLMESYWRAMLAVTIGERCSPLRLASDASRYDWRSMIAVT